MDKFFGLIESTSEAATAAREVTSYLQVSAALQILKSGFF